MQKCYGNYLFSIALYTILSPKISYRQSKHEHVDNSNKSAEKLVILLHTRVWAVWNNLLKLVLCAIAFDSIAFHSTTDIQHPFQSHHNDFGIALQGGSLTDTRL